MKRVYIAGPMSGLPELNHPAFNAAASALRGAGYDVVNPAELVPDPGTEWHACMRTDIRELVTCDAVALLPGWETSRGACIEQRLAGDILMCVTTVDALLGVAEAA